MISKLLKQQWWHWEIEKITKNVDKLTLHPETFF